MQFVFIYHKRHNQRNGKLEDNFLIWSEPQIPFVADFYRVVEKAGNAVSKATARVIYTNFPFPENQRGCKHGEYYGDSAIVGVPLL